MTLVASISIMQDRPANRNNMKIWFRVKRTRKADFRTSFVCYVHALKIIFENKNMEKNTNQIWKNIEFLLQKVSLVNQNQKSWKKHWYKIQVSNQTWVKYGLQSINGLAFISSLWENNNKKVFFFLNWIFVAEFVLLLPKRGSYCFVCVCVCENMRLLLPGPKVRFDQQILKIHPMRGSHQCGARALRSSWDLALTLPGARRLCRLIFCEVRNRNLRTSVHKRVIFFSLDELESRLFQPITRVERVHFVGISPNLVLSLLFIYLY